MFDRFSAATRLSVLLISLFLFGALGASACSDDKAGAGAKEPGTNNSSADAGDALDAEGEADSAEEHYCEGQSDCPSRPNQGASCDTSRNRCVYICDSGFADCNGDPADGCEVDLHSDVDNCGSCGNTCGDNEWNFAPRCRSTAGGAEAHCAIDSDACAPGFVNLDGDKDTGCECEISDPEDPIDLEGLDENCDGVDGILLKTVFVSEGAGDDENHDGLTPDAPVRSLVEALEIAKETSRDTILLSGGEYKGAIELAEGVSIYGGYADDFSSRDVEGLISRVALSPDDLDEQPEQYTTVVARGISSRTILDHITIQGADAESSASGMTTTALQAISSEGLHVQNSRILAGDGSAGAHGEPGELDENCGDRDEVKIEGGKGGAASDASPCDPRVNHGTRAHAGSSGGSSDPDATPSGGGGIGGYHFCYDEGDPDDESKKHGVDGSPGVLATNGSPGTRAEDAGIGSFSDEGVWKPYVGEAPTDGSEGGGGGGGGAGRNYERAGDLRLGTVGGRGGDGGCGGLAGENGQPGGSSFGVVVIGAPISAEDTTIVMGSGAKGGNGGVGHEGEDEGRAPQAGEPAGNEYAGQGGQGGYGAVGGIGGHGLGGDGGHSVGLAAYKTAMSPEGSFIIERGSAAAGGAGEGVEDKDDPSENDPEDRSSEKGREGILEDYYVF